VTTDTHCTRLEDSVEFKVDLKSRGFTLAEMHLLVHGFSQETPASERWQPLARKKLQEVEALITRAQQTKHLLECLLQCQCLRLEECVQGG
jgi:MerR family transcriptional regulator, redox-sensitive transcriptional activator SoxR